MVEARVEAIGTKIDGVVPSGYLTRTLREHKIPSKGVRLYILREHIAYYEVEKHTLENTDKNNWQKVYPERSHVLKKYTPTGGTSPYTQHMEIPPPPPPGGYLADLYLCCPLKTFYLNRHLMLKT